MHYRGQVFASLSKLFLTFGATNIIENMKTLFDEPNSAPAAESNKQRLLKELAWYVHPVNDKYGWTFITKTTNIPQAQVKQLINELVDESKLISLPDTGYRVRKYRLPARLQLELLLEIKKDPKAFEDRPLAEGHNWNLNTRWAVAIQTFVAHGEEKDMDIPAYIDETDDKGLSVFVSYMPAYKEWLPFFNKIPTNVISTVFYIHYRQWALRLQQPDMTCMNQGYLENPGIPEEIRQKFHAEFAFCQYVLPGKLKEFAALTLPPQPMYQCIRALCLQYEGKISEAVKTYQRALKELNTPFSYNVFYDFCHVLALAKDRTPSSRKKLEALARRKELKKNPYLFPIQLLLHRILNKGTQKLLEDYRISADTYPPLVRVLSTLLIQHYHLNDSIPLYETEISQLIDWDDMKILQLECSQDFQPFIDRAEQLREETGLSPLLPPYEQAEKWEKVISTLMEKVLSANKPDAFGILPKAESSSRIAYFVNEYAEITPRIQKSKDGITWSKGRNIALSTFQMGLPEMNDHDKIMSTYVECYSSYGWGRQEYWELKGAKPMNELAGYPLVFSESHPSVPVVITREKPQITVTKTANGFRIENNLGSATIGCERLILQKESDFLFHVITITSAQREVLNILSELKDFPKESEEQLALLLPQLGQVLTVHSDLVQSEKQLAKHEADTHITVQLQPMGEGIKAELFVKPFIGQPPYCKPGKGNVSVIGTIDDKRVQALRNLPEEEKNLQQLLKWLLPVSEDQDSDETVFFFADRYHCLDMLDILQTHLDEVRIEWPQGAKITLRKEADFNQLSLSVKGVGQWFQLEGELKVDAETVIKISDLLKKIRESKGRFIALSGNEFLALSDRLRKQLQAMDTLLEEDKGKLKLPSFTAQSLLKLEEQGVKLKKSATFKNLIKQIKEAGKKRISVPGQLEAELRDYQVDGFRWLARLASWGAGACLADDMGLGKTLQAIALLLARGKEGPSLVVAPVSILLNWKNELKRFAPTLVPLMMNEPGCDRKEIIKKAGEYDIVFTTYGLLVTESELLAGKNWNVIVLDEAHTIKNKDTKMSHAAMKLNGAFRLLLTGTPLQNHLGEIWNLFQFATPGLLGNFRRFTEKFINPIEKTGDKSKQRQLRRMLQPFILRRTKTEVLDELPEKTEITLHVELTEEERALYENLRREAISNLEEGSVTAVQALAEITKLRQAACHPLLVSPELDLPSAKSAAFLKLVEELMSNHHRALVFSQFTSHLTLIKKVLDKAGTEYLYLDGHTSPAERNRLVKAFQTGEQPLFLISLKAGGLGLNLTAADFVIHLDPWWNPSIEDQASDRAYRIGQTRPVTVYRLIATHTIEEQIMHLHQTKKSLADSLLDGSDLTHKLTKEEMLGLLKERE